MKIVCTQARDGVRLGQEVEIPDGASWSELYYAEAGTPEAATAIARAAAAEAPPSAPDGTRAPESAASAATTPTLPGASDAKDGV